MLAITVWAVLAPESIGERVVAAARDQLSWGTRYDPGYVRIPYPMGDVPRQIGVCTDVVIRAYRAVGVDLQRAIVEDKRRFPGKYPPGRLDRNIDHRRVANQRVYFRRHWRSIAPGNASWSPGDVICWRLPNGRDHTGIVSDRKGRRGWPLIIHNIGPAPAEEDVLKAWPITGHFRK